MTTPKQIRKDILTMGWKSKASHLGSALSLVEILYALYFQTANFSKEKVHDPERDKIILSKGHGSVALYSVLNRLGIISDEDIESYSQNGGRLPCHIDMTSAEGLEASAGSLGHGAGIGVGMALANKMDARTGRIFVIVGDGEIQEGSVWEAVALASTQKLDNFTLIVDFNGIQASDFSNKTIDQRNLSERLTAFGFDACDVDGHDVDALTAAFKKRSDKPTAIVAHTVKGKGVSFMENTVQSHYTKLTDKLCEKALADVEGM